MAEQEKNNSYKFRGTIVEMPDAKVGYNVSGEWKIQYVIVEEHEFKKKYQFEVYGKDKCDKFDLHVGEEVIFYFNLSSKEYNGKYYTSLKVWNVYKLGTANNGNSNNTPSPVETKKPVEEAPITDVNQLPF